MEVYRVLLNIGLLSLDRAGLKRVWIKFILFWLMPVFLMLSIRLPWLAILGVERFFLPYTEAEFYLGQSIKYCSLILIMILAALRLGLGLRDFGLSSRVRTMFSEAAAGGIFTLFYIFITWVLTLSVLNLIPRDVETIHYNLLFGFVIPRGMASEFVAKINPLTYIVYMTIVPSVVEEVYFRGYSMTILRKIFRGEWSVNLAQASLFSILHWYRGLLAGILPMAIFGIIFGYITIKNEYRITSALTGHLITNVLSAVTYIRGVSRLALM